MAKYTIQATTAAEFQVAVVKWLKENLAQGYRNDARMTNGVRRKELCNKQAEVAEAAARFIEEIVIEQPSNFGIVDQLLTEDKYIEAIKEHRALVGIGLKYSKEYCDRRRVELGLTTNQD